MQPKLCISESPNIYFGLRFVMVNRINFYLELKICVL